MTSALLPMLLTKVQASIDKKYDIMYLFSSPFHDRSAYTVQQIPNSATCDTLEWCPLVWRVVTGRM